MFTEGAIEGYSCETGCEDEACEGDVQVCRTFLTVLLVLLLELGHFYCGPLLGEEEGGAWGEDRTGTEEGS